MTNVRLLLSLLAMLSLCSDIAGANGTKVPQAKAAFEAGLNNRQKNRIRQAMASFSMSIGSDKNFADAYAWRGLCHYDLDQIDEAMADVDKAIAIDPKLPLSHHVRSDVLLARRDLHAAFKEMNEACLLAPKDPGNFYSRAKLHEMLGEKKQASDDYQHVMDIDKTGSIGCFRLANLELGMGKYKEAIDHYTQNLKYNDPEHLEATYNNRATCYDKIGRHDLAKKDRDKARGMTEGTWGQLMRPMK